MLYIIDTANLEKIKHCNEFYPIDGVTTNPTIISRENCDFKKLITSIREIIGPDKMLHIQTTATDADKIVEEAKSLRELLGENFYIKIPITEDGLKATMELKKLGIGVTVTAIFTQQQALMAAKAGADFVKLFPITNLGTEYVKAVKAPLSHIKFLAVGGINENNMADYLKAGVCGFGIGSNIVNKKFIDSGDYASITQLAKKYTGVTA